MLLNIVVENNLFRIPYGKITLEVSQQIAKYAFKLILKRLEMSFRWSQLFQAWAVLILLIRSVIGMDKCSNEAGERTCLAVESCLDFLDFLLDFFFFFSATEVLVALVVLVVVVVVVVVVVSTVTSELLCSICCWRLIIFSIATESAMALFVRGFCKYKQFISGF